MIRLINRIKSNILLVLFLLWHDKEPRGATKWLILTTLSLIGTLWGFPLENMMKTKEMLPQTQYTIRLIGMFLFLIVGLACLIYLLRSRYKKFTQPHKLTDEELKTFLKYMNESK